MSSPRKASPKKSGGKKKSGGTSRSAKAGLTMPVGRIGRLLHEGNFAPRIAKHAPVFVASALEYLVSELVQLAGDLATEHKKKRITPRFLNLAIRKDTELSQLLNNATIAGGGVVPNVLKVLSKKKGKRSSSSSKSGSKSKKERKSKSKKDKKEKKEKKDKKKKDKKEEKKESATAEA